MANGSAKAQAIAKGVLIGFCALLVMLCEFVALTTFDYQDGAQDTCAAATLVAAGTIALAISASRLKSFDWTIATLNAFGVTVAVMGVMVHEIDFLSRITQLALAAAVVTVGVRNSSRGLSPLTLRLAGGAIVLSALMLESSSTVLFP